MQFKIVNANLEFVGGFAENDLCYSLSRFVRDVRKLNGSEFPPNTVQKLVIMIQMFLHETGLMGKLLDEVAFCTLWNAIDNTMKEYHVLGLGVRKYSDIISLQSEEKMFNLGLLGDEGPMQLLRTMIYMIGLHCTLRGGEEHTKLQYLRCNSQFRI